MALASSSSYSAASTSFSLKPVTNRIEYRSYKHLNKGEFK
jgi:hypothetical protein